MKLSDIRWVSPRSNAVKRSTKRIPHSILRANGINVPGRHRTDTRGQYVSEKVGRNSPCPCQDARLPNHKAKSHDKLFAPFATPPAAAQPEAAAPSAPAPEGATADAT